MATIEFRDGRREIPDYLYDVLRRYEKRLYQITHDEAMELANRTMEHDVVERQLGKVISTHFGTHR